MKNNKRIEKFLCLVLRHTPEVINAVLDDAGWINTSTLVDLVRKNSQYKDFSMAKLIEITNNSEKQRFEYKTVNTWNNLIRARQGHSVDVNLGYLPSIPPEILYHGSEESVRGFIFKDGIKKMNRHAIHLYSNKDIVSSFSNNRKKQPVIYSIDSKRMSENGHQFYHTDNDVWLVDFIAPEYIICAESIWK